MKKRELFPYDDDADYTPVPALKTLRRACRRTMCALPPAGGVRKVKRYQETPHVDPGAERCRRNAVNAKRNRDLKKAYIDHLEGQLREARAEAKKLREAATRRDVELAEQRAELGNLRALVEETIRLTKPKGPAAAGATR